MTLLLDIFHNNVFIAVLIAAVVSQLIKIHFLVIRQKQKLRFKDIFLTGGMPSSHSAVVTSLVVIIGLVEGFTPLFITSAVLAAIVFRDAMGVRRTAGEEGKTLNQIIKKSGLKIPEMHYSLGHTPKEVFVGIIIGLLSAFLVFFLL